jgi:UPF0755 protein
VAFVTLAGDSAFMSRLGVPSLTAEGFLFPDTYDVEWQEAPASLISRMVRRFFGVFDDSMRTRAAEMGMTVTEAVTLASIIEKEAMLDSERPHISAVFHNRLDRGMRLQADPTVRYALRKWSGRILYRDLKVDSPYNTYVVYGLPPHPICNPGAASLVAALYPLPGSNDVYFVAQGDGSHYFSTTVAEHNRAKARYRRYLEGPSKADSLGGEAGACGLVRRCRFCGASGRGCGSLPARSGGNGIVAHTSPPRGRDGPPARSSGGLPAPGRKERGT